MKNICKENTAGQWQDEVTHLNFLIPGSTQIYSYTQVYTLNTFTTVIFPVMLKCRLKKKKHRNSPPNRQAENRVGLPSWFLFSCATYYVALDQRQSTR